MSSSSAFSFSSVNPIGGGVGPWPRSILFGHNPGQHLKSKGRKTWLLWKAQVGVLVNKVLKPNRRAASRALPSKTERES